MSEVVEFDDVHALKKYIVDEFKVLGCRVLPEQIEIKPYTYDARIGWDTHIVLVQGRAHGFTDGSASGASTFVRNPFTCEECLREMPRLAINATMTLDIDLLDKHILEELANPQPCRIIRVPKHLYGTRLLQPSAQRDQSGFPLPAKEAT